MFISTTGQPQQYKQNPTHMTHPVDAHTILLSGKQVRNMPTCYVSGDKKAKNANFDDMPEIDAACSKLFP